jgi:hypothetical protein
VRGDSHYGRSEAMDWCESNGVDYVFGFGGNFMPWCGPSPMNCVCGVR